MKDPTHLHDLALGLKAWDWMLCKKTLDGLSGQNIPLEQRFAASKMLLQCLGTEMLQQNCHLSHKATLLRLAHYFLSCLVQSLEDREGLLIATKKLQYVRSLYASSHQKKANVCENRSETVKESIESTFVSILKDGKVSLHLWSSRYSLEEIQTYAKFAIYRAIKSSLDSDPSSMLNHSFWSRVLAIFGIDSPKYFTQLAIETEHPWVRAELCDYTRDTDEQQVKWYDMLHQTHPYHSFNVCFFQRWTNQSTSFLGTDREQISFEENWAGLGDIGEVAEFTPFRYPNCVFDSCSSAITHLILLSSQKPKTGRYLLSSLNSSNIRPMKRYIRASLTEIIEWPEDCKVRSLLDCSVPLNGHFEERLSYLIEHLKLEEIKNWIHTTEWSEVFLDRFGIPRRQLEYGTDDPSILSALVSIGDLEALAPKFAIERVSSYLHSHGIVYPYDFENLMRCLSGKGLFTQIKVERNHTDLTEVLQVSKCSNFTRYVLQQFLDKELYTCFWIFIQKYALYSAIELLEVTDWSLLCVQFAQGIKEPTVLFDAGLQNAKILFGDARCSVPRLLVKGHVFEALGSLLYASQSTNNLHFRLLDAHMSNMPQLRRAVKTPHFDMSYEVSSLSSALGIQDLPYLEQRNMGSLKGWIFQGRAYKAALEFCNSDRDVRILYGSVMRLGLCWMDDTDRMASIVLFLRFCGLSPLPLECFIGVCEIVLKSLLKRSKKSRDDLEASVSRAFYWVINAWCMSTFPSDFIIKKIKNLIELTALHSHDLPMVSKFSQHCVTGSVSDIICRFYMIFFGEQTYQSRSQIFPEDLMILPVRAFNSSLPEDKLKSAILLFEIDEGKAMQHVIFKDIQYSIPKVQLPVEEDVADTSQVSELHKNVNEFRQSPLWPFSRQRVVFWRSLPEVDPSRKIFDFYLGLFEDVHEHQVYEEEHSVLVSKLWRHFSGHYGKLKICSHSCSFSGRSLGDLFVLMQVPRDLVSFSQFTLSKPFGLESSLLHVIFSMRRYLWDQSNEYIENEEFAELGRQLCSLGELASFLGGKRRKTMQNLLEAPRQLITETMSHELLKDDRENSIVLTCIVNIMPGNLDLIIESFLEMLSSQNFHVMQKWIENAPSLVQRNTLAALSQSDSNLALLMSLNLSASTCNYMIYKTVSAKFQQLPKAFVMDSWHLLDSTQLQELALEKIGEDEDWAILGQFVEEGRTNLETALRVWRPKRAQEFLQVCRRYNQQKVLGRFFKEQAIARFHLWKDNATESQKHLIKQALLESARHLYDSSSYFACVQSLAAIPFDF